MPKADHISPGGVRLLQEPQIAHFVTLLSDGSPQVTPVWVDVEPDGSHVIINTSVGNLKTQNVSRNSRVAVSVVDKNDPWRYVLVRGTVVAQQTEGADDHINKMAHKYLGLEAYPWRRSGQQRVILRIKPHHVLELGVED
ncbi:MAG: PPOX class F420-dependent oxidoreductase [Chloroflexi bacterium]|nr:PPOX class F420-dependent oxidoreductase [Chloroflexota bacterium]